MINEPKEIRPEEIIEIKNRIKDHSHSGTDSRKVRAEDLNDTFILETVSVAPTVAPSSHLGRMVVYINGATYRFYVWDNTNKAWKYTTLT